MFCSSCGSPAPEHSLACTVCGASLLAPAPARSIWAPPSPSTRVEVPWGPPVPISPVTASISDVATSSLVWDVDDLVADDDSATPSVGFEWDTQWLEPEGQVVGAHVALPLLPSRGRAVALMVAAVVAAAASVLTALMAVMGFDVRSEVNGALSLKANDFSSNSIVACLIVAVLLVVGAAAAASGRRFGAGVAVGAGAAGAGQLLWIAAQALAVVDTITAGLHAKGVSYELATTLDVGFWAAVVGAGLCVVVIGLAWGWSRNDGREPHHPALGVFGSFATLVLAAGLMVPVGGAALADNFSNDHPVNAVRFGKAFIFYLLAVDHQPQPPVTWLLRLALILLIVGAGLVAFLKGTRFSIGIAVGLCPMLVWMWVTSVLQAGDRPFSIAGGNPGGSGFESHLVTSVGVMMLVAASVIGVVAAFVVRRD